MHVSAEAWCSCGMSSGASPADAAGISERACMHAAHSDSIAIALGMPKVCKKPHSRTAAGACMPPRRSPTHAANAAKMTPSQQ